MSKIHDLLLMSISFITPICLTQNFQNLRDPFSLPTPKKSDLQETKKIDDIDQINLIGITKVNDNVGAILQKGFNQEVVFLNENIWGYRVESINEGSVIIKKEGRFIRLSVK
jgi:type II secretory pathway component PulC